MRRINYISILFIALLTIQCAKQTAPTGGPKDEEPPKLTKATPPDQKTNFKDEKVELEFNELVQLNNPREQLIITPSIGTFGKDYEIIAKKNKVILTFKSKLQENTTYSINLRESVADLNEKNSKQLKLALSTGPYIDSLYISGNIADALTTKPSENYTVAVVEQSDTFDIFKHKAMYFTFTDKEGNFSLENLKEGKYLVYTFQDKNKNLKVDSRTEPYGFLTEPILLNTPIKEVKIYTFKLDGGSFKLVSARDMFGVFNIKTSKSIVNYSIESLTQNKELIYQQDKDLSNLKIYNTIKGIDSLLFKFTASDSAENKIDTLLYLKYTKEQKNKDKFQASYKTEYLTETKMLETSINFSKPVLTINYDSIYIHLDSANTIKFTDEEIEWNKLKTELKVKKKIESFLNSTTRERKSKEDKPKAVKIYNKLILAKGSIISVEQDTLETTQGDIKKINPEDVGIITYKVNGAQNTIVQLLDKDYKIVSENTSKDSSFKNIQAGTYYLRLILDDNNNGKWDPGNYKNKINPEKTYFYTNSKEQQEINIKANWELGPLLINH